MHSIRDLFNVTANYLDVSVEVVDSIRVLDLNKPVDLDGDYLGYFFEEQVFTSEAADDTVLDITELNPYVLVVRATDNTATALHLLVDESGSLVLTS